MWGILPRDFTSSSTVWVLFCIFTVAANNCPSICRCYSRTADCSNQNLTYIPRLPQGIQKINLSGNFYQNLTSKTFENVSRELKVNYLDLSECNILVVGVGAFKGFQNLTHLNISYNVFEEVNLSDILNLGIEELDLSGTKININRFAAVKSRSIRKLFLDKNKIKNRINSSIFENLPNIENLTLDDNGIYNISLEGLGNISILSLKLNEIIFFPLFCDSNNKSLTPSLVYLDVQQNHISNLKNLEKSSMCLTSLTHLDLSYNPIRILRNDTFVHLPNLTNLYLKNLFSVENIFEERSLSSTSLLELHIGNIGAKYPPSFDSSCVFHNIPKLMILKMARFDLMNANMSLLLEFLINLEELVIYDCHLLQIPHIISNLTRLKILDFGSNFIGTLHAYLFEDLKYLESLSLTANRFSVIDNNSISISTLDSLSLLDLRFNPYACTCDLYWFINSVLIERRGILFQKEQESYQCSSPINLYNRTLTVYNPSYYECHSLSTQGVIAITAVSIFILLIILVVLYKKYKWHIKYYAYLLRSRKGYEKIEGTDESDFLFDAFVAYNEDDRSWVISNLMSELEGKEQYRLCLHERDFLPGRTIFSQISHTIQRSRKVILVISNSFAKSQWCQYETLVAQNRLIDDGANVLIVVLLGEIQSKYMTDSLHMLFRSMTYIRWPQAHSLGRELFWNKIKLAMKQ
ncbi:toll-like receptor 4 [Saccostrea cucullata]|uniref:toll-like receptor 4 n=1 Tax=Saccostrea cuccullata TaxID=36930 RepID=UPI002ED0E631